MEAGPPLDNKMWDAIEQVSSELLPFRGKLTRLGTLKREDQIEALTAQFNVSLKGLDIDYDHFCLDC